MPQAEAASLLIALAARVAAEGRPEAKATAQALLQGALEHQHPPCPLDAEIRKLAEDPKARPEAPLIAAAQTLIPWGISPLGHLQPGRIGAIKAVATLLGPDAPIRHRTLLCGLFFQVPGSYYPLHDHLADETYMILAGSALWTAGEDKRWRGPGEAIHHPSRMPHAFRAGPQGLLAIWRWSGDTRFDSYRLLPDPKDTN